MTGSQDNRIAGKRSPSAVWISVILSRCSDQPVSFLLKWISSSALDDIITHGADDAGKFIGTDMGMGFKKDIFFCTKPNKEVEDALDIASFITPGIELTVAIGTGSSFPETIIAFGVDNTQLYSGWPDHAAGHGYLFLFPV